MRAAEALRLTELTAQDLRARGDDERARALEDVLSVAVAALGAPAQSAPLAYLTFGQAARVLGGSLSFVKELVERGEIQVERLGKRRLIGRDTLLAYLDRLKSDPLPMSTLTPDEVLATKRLHDLLVQSVPVELVA